VYAVAILSSCLRERNVPIGNSSDPGEGSRRSIAALCIACNLGITGFQATATSPKATGATPTSTSSTSSHDPFRSGRG
jgi:hypothetical protein